MLSIVSLPFALVLFGLVAAVAVWLIMKYGPPWMQPVAERIKKRPAIWGYILIFGALAMFLLAHSFTT